MQFSKLCKAYATRNVIKTFQLNKFFIKVSIECIFSKFEKKTGSNTRCHDIKKNKLYYSLHDIPDTTLVNFNNKKLYTIQTNKIHLSKLIF